VTWPIGRETILQMLDAGELELDILPGEVGDNWRAVDGWEAS
jgi:hypothetical protein